MEFVESTSPENYKALIARSIRLYRIGFNKTFGIALIMSFVVFLPRLIDFLIEKNVSLVFPLIHENHWLIVINLICFVLFITILERLEFTIEKKRDKLKKDFVLSLKKFPIVVLAGFTETLIYCLMYLAFLILFLILKKFNIIYTHNPIVMALVVFPFFLQVFIEIYLSFCLIFYMPLVVTENFGIFSSLIHSFRLVWGNWKRTFLIQVTPWFCFFLVLALMRFGGRVHLHVFYAPYTSTTLAATILHLFFFAMFIPWIASTLLVQLHDLELRYQLNFKAKRGKPKKKLSKK